jgi:hypothetical protein
LKQKAVRSFGSDFQLLNMQTCRKERRATANSVLRGNKFLPLAEFGKFFWLELHLSASVAVFFFGDTFVA